jgi:hypothetical protein
VTGRVRSVHRDGGVIVVRLDRVAVHVPAGTRDGQVPMPGELVGVTAAASDVRVFAR